MKKSLLFFCALLMLGISGVKADDVVVTISNQTDLASIDEAANKTTASEATATHKYGTYSGSDEPNTPYYTTFTTNATSGLAGVTLSTTAKIIKPTFIGGGNVAHYGHLIAINYDKADETVYTFTLKAPSGYYIKSYTFTALSTSDGAPFEIKPLGGSAQTTYGYLYKKTYTINACSTTAGFTVQRKSNNNANYLCIPTFTVTLAPVPTFDGYDTSIDINNTTGALNNGDSKWSSTWTSSKTTPSDLTINAGYNNMQQTATYIDIHSASSPTYTITAPAGYMIAGYKIGIYSGAAGSNITPSGYATAPVSNNSSDPTYVYVKGINAKTASFTRTGTSTNGYATTFTVYLKASVEITYIVKNSGGTEIFRSAGIETWPGSAITTLPNQFKRDFCSYNEISETADESKAINFTATWDYPFEISDTYEDAHWYNMAVRNTWYVTSDNVQDGALKTVNANALGLATDAYQWAIVGNPYNLKLFNKAKGKDLVYAWTAASNENVPTFVDAASGYSWTIKASTAPGYTNAIQFTIPDYGYQVNQFGGEGGLLKIWNWTGTGDEGSAFKIFDVPDDFAEYVTSEIAPYMENEAAYFNWTDEARTGIGYNASYKTSCTYAKYASMKTALTAALEDLSDKVNYPPTGYYRLHNRQHNTKYLGQEGNLVAFADDTKANTIVKLTKHPTTNTYTIQIQGKYIQEPDGEASGGYQVQTGDDEIWFTPTVKTIGYASLAAGSSAYNNIHCSGSSTILGWDSGALASHWAVEAATDAVMTLNDGGDGNYYATFCAPFSYTVGSGATAYTLEASGEILTPTPIDGEVTAGTPVLLQGTSSTATLTIGSSYATSPVTSTALTGTYLAKDIDGATDYVLGINGDKVGFYHWDRNNLAANRAYIDTPEGPAKGFVINWDIATGIKAMDNVQGKMDNAEIYNLAGQRMNRIQKGVNIVNGKKVLVK